MAKSTMNIKNSVVQAKINNITSNKIEFLKFLAVAAICAIANILFYKNKIISYGVVILEIILLFYELASGKYVKFIVYYFIFISLCLEYVDLGESEIFFNFKSIRLLGVNLGVWVALPAIILCLFKWKSISRKLSRYKTFLSFGRFFFLMNVVAFFVGLFLILFNDHSIRTLDNYLSAFAEEAYAYAFFPIFFFSVFSLIIAEDKSSITQIPLALQAVLYACIIQNLTSTVFSFHSYYGGNTVALCSSVFPFCMFLILFALYPNGCVYPKISSAIGVLGVVLGFATGAGGGGKGIILLFICLLIFGVRLIGSTKRINRFRIFVILCLVLAAALFILKLLAQRNDLLGWKLYNVEKLFAFGSGWLENMPHSPKVRVGEFLNVMAEYLRKPYLFFTGKGFLGTTLDYSNIWVDAEISYGAFTDAEWAVGAFYSMHEVTSLLLTFGLLGIIFVVKYFNLVIKNYRHSLWSLVGFYWLFIFYGYSFTIGVFGCAAFFYSLYEIDNRKIKKEIAKNANIGK